MNEHEEQCRIFHDLTDLRLAAGGQGHQEGLKSLPEAPNCWKSLASDLALGCRQAGKPSDFDSDIRRFESCHPIQFLSNPPKSNAVFFDRF